MLKLNKLEKQTIRPAAEVYDVCALLCSVAVQFKDEKNSVMLIGTYGNRRSCVRMGGPLQTDQMGLEVKHNGTVQIEVGKIGQSIIATHKKIESATVGTYKGVENYVVDATRPSRRLLWTGSSKKSRMKTTSNNRI